MLVSAADKLYNLRAIYFDYLQIDTKFGSDLALPTNPATEPPGKLVGKPANILWLLSLNP